MMASGLVALIVAALAQVLSLAQDQKKRLVSDIDAASLEMDIKKGLSNALLCDQNFVQHNSTFDTNTRRVNVQLADSEVIRTDQNLTNYSLKNVNVITENIQVIGNGPAGETYYTTRLVLLMERTNSKVGIRPRNLGDVHISTNSSGDIINCGSSLDNLVQCGNNEVKVGTGDSPSDLPICQSIDQLIGSLCPSGQFPVSSGGGIRCQRHSSRAVASPAASPDTSPSSAPSFQWQSPSTRHIASSNTSQIYSFADEVGRKTTGSSCFSQGATSVSCSGTSLSNCGVSGATSLNCYRCSTWSCR